jgi:hypothetical protein
MRGQLFSKAFAPTKDTKTRHVRRTDPLRKGMAEGALESWSGLLIHRNPFDTKNLLP